MVAARWLSGDRPETVRYHKELGLHGNSNIFRQYSYVIHFQIASFTKVILKIYLATEMVDWKQKLKNHWVQREISRVQPSKPGNFLPLVSFSFEYNSVYVVARPFKVFF